MFLSTDVEETKNVMKTKNGFNKAMGDIGRTLAMLRLQKGYTSIRDFTNEFGLPMIQYWRIERGKANITLKSLFKLLAIHSMTLQEFFCNLENQ